jgi:hypothetical protein
VKQKVALKDKKEKLRTQINRKFIDTSNADENKNKILLYIPYLKTIKGHYIY